MSEKPKATHIMLTFPTAKSEGLFRASDGIRIASRMEAVVILGEDPNKGTSRVFIDQHAAHEFIANAIPALDVNRAKFDWQLDVRPPLQHAMKEDGTPLYHVEYREGEGIIALPQGTEVYGMPGQGSIHKFNH